MSETIWECSGCESRKKPCLFIDYYEHSNGNIPNNQLNKCGPFRPVWKPVTNIQITKIPDPVWYLDIPHEATTFISTSLARNQGEIILKSSGSFDALYKLGWLKQKQPESTRIDRIAGKIRGKIGGGISRTLFDEVMEIINGES